ncbi:hypothetical protein PTSG_09812 [Salpingoeca rosetta]|uniref:F-box domain-containing protein n=1 Tax=Salpingoeca rosetta (strain ATCC 50818 / BSB-021) TaxID=946362 RepID=F2UP46_SALR5|nr:uncharacterized protein PTSG_09812 [Salpingoeca rosetta]EGD79401.1 hypothetical protein PTSG_09812 [Salpingoeca rosetta]|eukprot:XP_004989170.1 hypothetical protein PTSG_09812 [Salpingoeca rosetta]
MMDEQQPSQQPSQQQQPPAEVCVTDLPGELLSSILWLAGNVYVIDSVYAKVCRAFYHAARTRPLRSLVRKRLALDFVQIQDEFDIVISPEGFGRLLQRMPFIEHIRFTSELPEDIETLESTSVAGEFSSSDVAHLFASLQMADFSYMRFESVRLAEFAAAATQLRYLDLDENMVDEATAIAFASGCPNLTFVSLDGQGQGDALVAALANNCPHVRYLCIRFCDEMTDNAFKSLQQLRNLEWLCMKKAFDVSPQAVMDFFSSGAAQHLTRIDLTECNNLSNEDTCTLTMLCLKQCNLIDDRMVYEYNKARPELTIIEYFGQRLMSASEEQMFEDNLGYFTMSIFEDFPDMFSDDALPYLMPAE